MSENNVFIKNDNPTYVEAREEFEGLTDLTLVSQEGENFRAHRLVLARWDSENISVS